jgi:hypothetical protein
MLCTYLRIWLGILAALVTPPLHYQHADLLYKEGMFLLEVAQLPTGDYLVRVPHKFNPFMLCADLDILLATRHYQYSEYTTHRPVWVAKEDVVYDRDRRVFAFNYLQTSIDHSDRVLTYAMLGTLRLVRTVSDTSALLLSHYNNFPFMNALFDLFVSHTDRRTLVKKYVTMGPNMLQRAVPHGRVFRDWDRSKISRSLEL